MLSGGPSGTPDGDPGSLESLYRTHFQAVFRQCHARLWDREDAADATHDVFARAAQRTEPFESKEHARAWLLSVARNHCTDVLRRRGRLSQALANVGTGTESTINPETVAVDRQVARSVLAQLSLRERRLLWHSAVERQPLREIADRLRLNYLAAAQALRRARLRAVRIGARIAVVLGLVRLRRALPAALSVHPVLLLALIPLIAVSLPSSVKHDVERQSAITAAGAPAAGRAPLITKPVHLAVAATSGLTPAAAPTMLPFSAGPSVPQIAGVMDQLDRLAMPHQPNSGNLWRLAGTLLKSLPAAPAPTTLPSLPLSH